MEDATGSEPPTPRQLDRPGGLSEDDRESMRGRRPAEIRSVAGGELHQARSAAFHAWGGVGLEWFGRPGLDPESWESSILRGEPTQVDGQDTLQRTGELETEPALVAEQ